MSMYLILRIVAALAVLALVVPTVRLNREIEQRRASGEKSAELKQKEKTLRLMVRVLVSVFIVVLAAVMVVTYAPFFSK